MGLATVTLKASHDWDGIQGMHCGLANAAAVSSRAVNAAQHSAITSSICGSHECLRAYASKRADCGVGTLRIAVPGGAAAD